MNKCICESCCFLNRNIIIDDYYKCDKAKSRNPVSLFKINNKDKRYKWIFCSDYKEKVK